MTETPARSHGEAAATAAATGTGAAESRVPEQAEQHRGAAGTGTGRAGGTHTYTHRVGGLGGWHPGVMLQPWGVRRGVGGSSTLRGQGC